MLATLGVNTIDELFADIPDEFRNPSLALPSPMAELEVQQELSSLASKNRALGLSLIHI